MSWPCVPTRRSSRRLEPLFGYGEGSTEYRRVEQMTLHYRASIVS